MSRFFTFLAMGLGWSCGGPIGGLIGALLGGAIDRRVSGNNAPRLDYSHGAYGPTGTSHRGPYSNTGNDKDLIVSLVVLIAAVMRADGAPRQSELNYVKKFLRRNMDEDEAKEMLHILRGLINMSEAIEIDDVCRQIMVNTQYATRYQMYDFLFGLACADMEFSVEEHRLLQEIGRSLGISRSDYMSIKARRVSGSTRQGTSGNAGGSYSSGSSYGGTSRSKPDPYAVLGVSSSATDDEIKKAYRRLAMKYHPDKVESLGEEMKRNATEQFRTINEAYETVKTLRGIK